MTPIDQLIRYGAYIPVMTEEEQRSLAMGELHPSIYQICGWCAALARAQKEAEKRVSEAMKKQRAPQKNRK